MKYLHSHNVIHRDLKPENILTDENYYPRVCEVSNSRKLTMTGRIGTPLYMAPELFEEEGHYGPGVDVYAFSMLAYEIVSGETPFNELGNISPVSLGIKVASGYRPPIPESVPTKIAALIRRCWSHKAEDRPSFSEIFDELSNDFSMLGELLDEDEIRSYIEMISRREKHLKVFNFNTSNKKLQEEAFKLKKKCHKLQKKLKEKENCYQNEICELKRIFESSQLSRDYFSRGVCRLLGNEREKNEIEGVRYLKQSSEEGNSDSSFICALLYENGEGVEKVFEKSSFYYQRSAAQGNTYGMTRLGFYYEFGYGIEQDYLKSFEFYKKGSENGNSYAMNCVGICYEEGHVVEQNYSEAIEFYEKSAKLGNSNALCCLGIFLLQKRTWSSTELFKGFRSI